MDRVRFRGRFMCQLIIDSRLPVADAGYTTFKQMHACTHTAKRHLRSHVLSLWKWRTGTLETGEDRVTQAFLSVYSVFLLIAVKRL